MCHGKRLIGAQARQRVLVIIQWLHRQKVLRSREEANDLLRAAGMADLNASQSDDEHLINLLGTHSNRERRSRATRRAKRVEPVFHFLPHQFEPPPRDFTGRKGLSGHIGRQGRGLFRSGGASYPARRHGALDPDQWIPLSGGLSSDKWQS